MVVVGVSFSVALGGMGGTAVAAGVTVTGFSPGSGPLGTLVTVTGSGFLGATQVTLDGVAMTALSVKSSRKLTAKVPATASGAIAVSAPGGTGTSATSFLVTAAVKVTPAFAHPGQSVTVSGSGFAAGESVQIAFDRTPATLLTADGSGLINGSAIVPTSATPGGHTFQATGQTSSATASAMVNVDTNWALPGFSASGTGDNLYENVLSPSTVGSLAADYSISPPVSGDSFATAPAVANGVIYLTTLDGYLYAYPDNCGESGGTCSPLWQANTGASILGSPTVAGGVVYVANTAGDVVAYPSKCGAGDATCSPTWQATTGADDTAPTVAGGEVFVGSEDQHLYAFAVGCNSGGGSCAPLWQATTSARIESEPSVAGGVVYIGDDQGDVYAFAVNCGSGDATCLPIWQNGDPFNLGNVFGWPAVSGGIVYATGADGILGSYRTACGSGTCDLLGQDQTGGEIDWAPAVANGIVFTSAGDGHVYAFQIGCRSGNTATCSPLWQAAAGALTGPVLANGVVYLGTAASVKAYPESCGTGDTTCTDLLWTATLPHAMTTNPVVVNARVYAADSTALDVFAIP
jgi:outer membrane protein assembly factor BamB